MIEEVRFNLDGLVPVIAQDAHDGTILMLAWANKEALEETLRTGFGTYFLALAKSFGVKAKRAAIVRKFLRFCSTVTVIPLSTRSNKKEILPVTPAIEAAFTAAGTVKTGKRMLLS